MDLAQAWFETAGQITYAGLRCLLFNCDHGSVIEKGPHPGNWEAARPVENCSVCSRLNCYTARELM